MCFLTKSVYFGCFSQYMCACPYNMYVMKFSNYLSEICMDKMGLIPYTHLSAGS